MDSLTLIAILIAGLGPGLILGVVTGIVHGVSCLVEFIRNELHEIETGKSGP